MMAWLAQWRQRSSEARDHKGERMSVVGWEAGARAEDTRREHGDSLDEAGAEPT
jgi:hypothetical protein